MIFPFFTFSFEDCSELACDNSITAVSATFCNRVRKVPKWEKSTVDDVCYVDITLRLVAALAGNPPLSTKKGMKLSFQPSASNLKHQPRFFSIFARYLSML